LLPRPLERKRNICLALLASPGGLRQSQGEDSQTTNHLSHPLPQSICAPRFAAHEIYSPPERDRTNERTRRLVLHVGQAIVKYDASERVGRRAKPSAKQAQNLEIGVVIRMREEAATTRNFAAVRKGTVSSLPIE